MNNDRVALGYKEIKKVKIFLALTPRHHSQKVRVTKDDPQIGFPARLVISLTFLIGTLEKSSNF